MFKRGLVAALAVSWVIWFAFQPSAGNCSTVRGDALLASLAARYYRASWEFEPDQATATGVHDYDALLGSFTSADFERDTARLQITLAQLPRIPDHSLSLDGRIDKQILANSIRMQLFYRRDFPEWRLRPGFYNNIVSNAIYSLVARTFASPERRMRLVIARERQIPRVLAQAQGNLDPAAVAPIVAEYAAMDVDGSADFLAHDVPAAFAGVKDAQLRAEFQRSNALAIAALKRYARFIRSAVMLQARGRFALGLANYGYLAALENARFISVDRLLAVGTSALRRDETAFAATARAINPKMSPSQVMSAMAKLHPSADRLLPAAQQLLAGLLAFIRAKHIVDIPAGPIVKVTASPQFRASTTEAALDTPGPLERVATETHYFVTPVPKNFTRRQSDQYLALYNRFDLAITSAHEVYPGHYADYLFSKRSHLSLIRQIEWDPAFGEGWAHYGEQMMIDEGYGGADPRYQLAQLDEALLRDCRLIVGIKEHTRGMTVDQATRFFEVNAYLRPGAARGEAVRGTTDPLYGEYTWGKLMILKLRSDYQKKMGKRYTLAAFHDALRSHGDPPVVFLRQLLLGTGDNGQLL